MKTLFLLLLLSLAPPAALPYAMGVNIQFMLKIYHQTVWKEGNRCCFDYAEFR